MNIESCISIIVYAKINDTETIRVQMFYFSPYVPARNKDVCLEKLCRETGENEENCFPQILQYPPQYFPGGGELPWINLAWTYLYLSFSAIAFMWYNITDRLSLYTAKELQFWQSWSYIDLIKSVEHLRRTCLKMICDAWNN